jgi:glucose 1-dehydrogenase
VAVLVTGSSQGIGLAIALELASAGHDVAVCASTRTPALLASAKRVEEFGVRALALHGDLADPNVPAGLISAAADAFGGLDGVVANAGVAIAGPLAEQPVSDWDRMFAINVRATWLLARHALPFLQASGGSFVAVGSVSGMAPHAGMGGYSPSKAGLSMLVRQMAVEWGPLGVRANVVSPGFTLTPRTQHAVYGDADLLESRTAMVPLKRLADAGPDVAKLVRFLLSEDSSYCTGQVIAADGGLVDSVFTHDPGAQAYLRSAVQ